MKILHVTKRYPNSSGGDGTVVSNLRRHQEAAGHTVHILTSNCPDITDGPGITKFGFRIDSNQIDTISIKRILTMMGMTAYAFWFLRRNRPDIIHSHTMDFGFALSWAARLYQIPMINTCHGICFNNSLFSPAKRWLEVSLLRHARYHSIITVDANSLTDFQTVGLSQAVYRPNGVEPAKFHRHRNQNTEPLQILFVGRLEAQKGLPVLLEALKDVDATDSNFRVVVAGDGPDRAASVDLATKLGLKDRISFLGRRSPEELTAIYASSDIFVLPSMYEGFPIVLLEAWASSLPAVISNVGGVPKICHNGEDAMVVSPGDSNALAHALRTIMSDPALREKLGRNGRKLVESKYNYQEIMKDLQTIYNEVKA
jgi:glycosyltransferase involved in cell wall biosynthesis